jgi:ferredoxin-thioredoxin reductase catalytic subunit
MYVFLAKELTRGGYALVAVAHIIASVIVDTLAKAAVLGVHITPCKNTH